MQITVPSPDAIVERSRSTFLSRWLVLRFSKREKNGTTTWISEWKKKCIATPIKSLRCSFFSKNSRRRIATWTNKNESQSTRVRLTCFAMFQFFLPERNHVLSSDFLFRLGSVFFLRNSRFLATMRKILLIIPLNSTSGKFNFIVITINIF